jgi:hypothetical protein
MNSHTMAALGLGIVKLLISLFVGSGVGLLTFGLRTTDNSEIWMRSIPPASLFTALGAGLLSTALMMVLLFLLPRIFRKTSAKGAVYDEIAR